MLCLWVQMRHVNVISCDPGGGGILDGLARGWRYTKLSLSSDVLCVIVPSFLSFLFPCTRWSFEDVPLIFSCPADHVPDW